MTLAGASRSSNTAQFDKQLRRNLHQIFFSLFTCTYTIPNSPLRIRKFTVLPHAIKDINSRNTLRSGSSGSRRNRRQALECDSLRTVPELSKYEKNPHRSRPHGRVCHHRSRTEQRHAVRHAGRRPRLLEQSGRPQQLATRQRFGVEHLLRPARQRRPWRRPARHLHVGKRLQPEQRPDLRKAARCSIVRLSSV